MIAPVEVSRLSHSARGVVSLDWSEPVSRQKEKAMAALALATRRAIYADITEVASAPPSPSAVEIQHF